MVRTVTVSAKVPEELRRRMSELGIAPSKVIRSAIDDAVRKGEQERAITQAEAAGAIIRKVSKDAWVRAIREDRDSR
jgi:Fe2+ transport system protein FeoA